MNKTNEFYKLKKTDAHKLYFWGFENVYLIFSFINIKIEKKKNRIKQTKINETTYKNKRNSVFKLIRLIN